MQFFSLDTIICVAGLLAMLIGVLFTLWIFLPAEDEDKGPDPQDDFEGAMARYRRLLEQAELD